MMANWRLEPLERALPHLPLPLAIVHGAQDRAIKTADVRRVARLARAELELMPGLGHLLHEERPELAAARIMVGGQG
jgi:magnesium chelatase accessory protein